MFDEGRYGQKVEVSFYLPETLSVRLDQGDMVFLAAEPLSDVGTHLTRSYDDDSHDLILPHGEGRWGDSAPENAGLGDDQVHWYVPGAGLD